MHSGPMLAQRHMAGDCAGQPGSRGYRRDPECLRQVLVGRASGCGTQAVEAVSNAAQNGEKAKKRNQPESVSNEWVPQHGAAVTNSSVKAVSAIMLRVRHCVECPKCCTRYLPGFSPYRNGSYLMPLSYGLSAEWILYCSALTRMRPADGAGKN